MHPALYSCNSIARNCHERYSAQAKTVVSAPADSTISGVVSFSTRSTESWTVRGTYGGGEQAIIEPIPEVLSEAAIQKAQVFHNRKGLKEEIIIEGCLRELRATSETKEESIEQLIDQVSIWIPKLYHDNFLVNPRCIIILETKINEDEKAEVRFGVAMKCTVKSQLPEIKKI